MEHQRIKILQFTNKHTSSCFTKALGNWSQQTSSLHAYTSLPTNPVPMQTLNPSIKKRWAGPLSGRLKGRALRPSPWPSYSGWSTSPSSCSCAGKHESRCGLSSSSSRGAGRCSRCPGGPGSPGGPEEGRDAMNAGGS